QVREVERLVNDKINFFLPVTTQEMSIKEAAKLGAVGLFEDKYGDVVRVVTAGDYSMELCGGMHVDNTGQIGAFKILNESGIASGVRRIEAITGMAIVHHLDKCETAIEKAATALKSTPDLFLGRLDSLIAENKEYKQELNELKKKSFDAAADKMIEDAKEINGIRLITRLFKDFEIDDLRKISDDVKSKHKNVAMVFAAQKGEKVTFLVSLTDDVVSGGHHAGKMIKEIAAAAGGGGGGKADMAQAGAKDPSKVEDAFAVAEKLL
ncbi:MAG: DHHA1 domain-containing protein, partial [Anaerovoracaceae bacterium]